MKRNKKKEGETMAFSALSARIERYAAKLDFPRDATAELQAILQKMAANGSSFSRVGKERSFRICGV